MPYEFNMPHKIQVILEAIKATTEIFDGIDTNSPHHKLLEGMLQALQNRLVDEIDKVPSE